MEVIPVKLAALQPPKDDLLAKIIDAKPDIQEGDCVAVASKVVSIWQGRCVPGGGLDKKDEIAKQEAELYLERSESPHSAVLHTLKHNYLVASAGIDSNNANGYFVLWPEKPHEVAQELLQWFKKTYGVSKLSLVITDSHSTPLRRGAMGFALGWAGFNPLYDHSGEPDVFGQKTAQGSTTNLADSIATAAVLVMGEVGEQTPLAIIRGIPYMDRPNETSLAYELSKDEDIFAPFLKVNWKKGGSSAQE